MPYNYLTLGQAKLQLAARLYDTSANLFWSDTEKGRYITEALRCWNSLTSYWRSEFLFDTVAGQTWYDIPAQAKSLRKYTVTDNDLINLIENHLLEPESGTAYPLAWAGSSQFSLTDILYAIQRKRDEVLSATGCTVTQTLINAIPGRTFLPDNNIDIRRVAWLPVANPDYVAIPLWPSDEFALLSYERGFSANQPGNPQTYRRSTEPPVSFDVDIQPAVNGQYDIITVNAGPAVNNAQAVALGIPDDFSWVIKWGALADLLGRESNAKDALRASYCDKRYRQGVAMLLMTPAVLAARISNLPMDIESVRDVDNYRPTWQAGSPSQPDTMLVAGPNLIALANIPDDVYSVTATVVQNMPVPVLDTDPIPVGPDDLEAILDYAQHIASFKMGGLEFLSTISLLERFHKRAGLYNNKLNEMGEFTKPIYEQSQGQTVSNPVYEVTPSSEEL